MNSNKVKKFAQFINESVACDKDVVKFLKKKMAADKKEYKGDIPTKYNKGSKWDNSSWYVDEIMAFLSNSQSRSYTLREFGRECSYKELEKILKDHFKKEFKEALKKLEDK